VGLLAFGRVKLPPKRYGNGGFPLSNIPKRFQLLVPKKPVAGALGTPIAELVN
jgi:hypothetical protein